MPAALELRPGLEGEDDAGERLVELRRVDAAPAARRMKPRADMPCARAARSRPPALLPSRETPQSTRICSSGTKRP
jgi:hypothetical protein